MVAIRRDSLTILFAISQLDKFLKETKSAELLVGQPRTAAGAKVKVMEAERQAAEARLAAAPHRAARDGDRCAPGSALLAPRSRRSGRARRPRNSSSGARLPPPPSPPPPPPASILNDNFHPIAHQEGSDRSAQEAPGRRAQGEQQFCVVLNEQARRASSSDAIRRATSRRPHPLPNEQRLKISLLDAEGASCWRRNGSPRRASCRCSRAMVQEKLKAASARQVDRSTSDRCVRTRAAFGALLPRARSARRSSSSASVTRAARPTQPARPQTSSGEAARRLTHARAARARTRRL